MTCLYIARGNKECEETGVKHGLPLYYLQHDA